MQHTQAFLKTLATVLSVLTGISAVIADARLNPLLYWLGVFGFMTAIALVGLFLLASGLSDHIDLEKEGSPWLWIVPIAAGLLGLIAVALSIGFDGDAKAEAREGGFGLAQFGGLVVVAALAGILVYLSTHRNKDPATPTEA